MRDKSNTLITIRHGLGRVKRFALRCLGAAFRNRDIWTRKYKFGRRLLSLRIGRSRPIRVAFLHMYATSNQTLPIFDLMLGDNNFDPYFIVNPDVMRSKENAKQNYERSKRELIAKYGADRVLDGVDVSGSAIDYTAQFDLCTTNNPYDGMSDRVFKIEHWTRSGIPMFYSSYFYMGRCTVSIANLELDTSNYFWRFYADNSFVKELAYHHQRVRGRNIVVTGSPKIDGYSKVRPASHIRKCILVAPHHSIGKIYPESASFLEYADGFPALVKRYPQIDFLFRPHPLLFEHLRMEYWGAEKTESYIAVLKAIPNLKFSETADYLQEFADTDAMIHDCGSFAAEYLFTGKPCAYVWRKTVDPDKLFTRLGMSCVNSHYVCHGEREIIDFIENVVIAGNDPMKEEREKFAKEKLMFNYPHASEAIVADIKKALGRK